jgi:hypothetical protein
VREATVNAQCRAHLLRLFGRLASVPVSGEIMVLRSSLGAACLLLSAFIGVPQAFAVELTRDEAIGAKFGAPGPRVCSTMSEPQNGPLTADEARAYVICGTEADSQGGSENLFLLSDVEIQTIQSRPFNDDGFDGIDPSKTVYDITGTSVVWVCSMLDSVLPLDQQCKRTPNPHDTGVCYQLTTGEWRCSWGDFNVPMSTDSRLNVPAPTLGEVE